MTTRHGLSKILCLALSGVAMAGLLLTAAPVAAQNVPVPPEAPATGTVPEAAQTGAAQDAPAASLIAPLPQTPAAPQLAPSKSLRTQSDELAEVSARENIVAEPAAGGASGLQEDEIQADAAAQDIVPAPDPLAPLRGALSRAQGALETGGPAIWAIAMLSVVTVALILWKTWRLVLMGAWSRRISAQAVAQWEAGDAEGALALVTPRRGLRSRFCTAMMQGVRNRPAGAAREDATRVAREILSGASGGLRALDLIATIAPLLGLLGTVLGMIAAFQALQEAGSRADPALLAGGIWEALLTTAAGMAVAIPASVALTWFEAVIDRVREDMESFAARIFVHEAGMIASGSVASEAGLRTAAEGQAALVAQ